MAKELLVQIHVQSAEAGSNEVVKGETVELLEKEKTSRPTSGLLYNGPLSSRVDDYFTGQSPRRI